MFVDLRRRDMKVGEEDIVEVLEKGEYGIISTIGENGYPYGIPMSYIYKDDSIYFHCGRYGHKIDNFEYCDKVSFTIVYDTELVPENLDHHYKSVIAFGKLVEVSKDEKINALRELVKKYAKGYEGAGEVSIEEEESITKVFRIDIEHREGKFRWGNQKA